MEIYDNLYPSQYKFKYPKAGEDNSLIAVKVFDLDNLKTYDFDIGKNPDIYIPRIMWSKKDNELIVFKMNRLQNNLDKIDYLYNIKNTQTRIIQQLGENNKKNTFLNSKTLKIENDIRLLMIFFQNKERDHQREKELQKALRLRELDKIREEHKLIISELKKVV